jgi:hypothetical protein
MAKTVEANGTTNPVSVKVTLRHTKPPIWRRLLVPGDMTLGDLHVAIQAAMGWHDGHLHAFHIADRQYGNPRQVDDVADETRMTVNRLVKSGIDRFGYVYDFGDSWEHAILIEKTRPKGGDGTSYPACVGGKRNCPPEDCGGPWGYAQLLEVLADPTHPEHAEQSEWLGRPFDPDAFSVSAADAALARYFKRA